MNIATDHRFFGVSQPLSPSENKVLQQSFSLTVPNGHRLQSMDTFKDFMKQRPRHQNLCHLERHITGMAYNLRVWHKINKSF